MPTQAKPMDKKSYKQEFLEMVKEKSGLLTAIRMEEALKNDSKQMKEAQIDHGVPLEGIAQTQELDLNKLLGTKAPEPQPEMQQQPQPQPQQPQGQQPQFTPAQGMFSPAQQLPTGQIQEGGALSWIGGHSTSDLLKKMLIMSKIQGGGQGYMMSPEAIAAKTKEAQDALAAQGLTDYNARVGAKGQIMTSKQTSGMGSALVKFAEKNAPALADAVSQGDFSGYINSDKYTKSAVARTLQERHIPLTQEELDYRAKIETTPNAKLQDAKVNQAIHLRSLVDQYYDSKTGNYNIPYAQYSEMVMGLANLVANSNETTDNQRKEINQRTMSGDINGLATYLSGSPKNASTQDMMKNLIASIDRQGKVSEKIRGKYTGDSKYGNSFEEYLKSSPSQQKTPNNQQPTSSFKVIRVRQ